VKKNHKGKSNHHDDLSEVADKSYRKEEPWRVFRIISEFVVGFEEMEKVGPAVSIFGSARTARGSAYYKLAENIGRELAKAGYAVITGGGPGIMEAANKGAKSVGGKSIGLSIELPFEAAANDYVTMELRFNYFFVRKVMFVKYAKGFIAMPGGYGTLDEFYESLTLIQTQKVQPFPIVMIGKEYWGGLLTWMRNKMLGELNIKADDLKMFYVTDDALDAVNYIKNFHRKRKNKSLKKTARS
jgi:uncharacterized protein (TIGR00730 family)